jgi:hypothetical protein
MRRWPVLIVVLALVSALAACSGSDTGTVEEAGAPQQVSVEQVRSDPEAYEGSNVRFTGSVTRVIPSTTDRQAVLVDEVLVIVPEEYLEGIGRGDRVTVTGTLNRVDAGDTDIFSKDEAGEEGIAEFEGDPAVFATEFAAA